MEIHMLILDGRAHKNGYTKPDKLIFKGNFALESCILKLIESYYGCKLKDKVEDMLTSRITNDDIPEELFKEDKI